MPGSSCPLSCPCRRAGEGAFLLALAAYAAVFSPAFLGADFGVLVSGFVNAPHHAPLALILWAVVVLAGWGLFGFGLMAALEENEETPITELLAVMPVSTVAIWEGWYLPSSWGAGWWMLASRGVYIAVIAAGGLNAILALRAHVWHEAFKAGCADGGATDLSDCLTLIDRQAAGIAALTAERDRLAHDLAHRPPARDLETFIEILGGRRKVLAWLHPDGVKGDAEKRAANERFQKASAVFDGLGGSGKR
jgi:hypothetical protein